MAVDREIHSDIVNALQAIGGLAMGHMLKDDVIKLMLQNSQLMRIIQLTEKLRVIKKLKLRRIRIHAHPSGRNRGRADLVDPARERSKERLAHQKASGMHVEVEGLICHVFSLHYKYSHEGIKVKV